MDKETQDSQELWDILSRECPAYIEALGKDEHAGILEPDFMGFVTKYKHLAEIIPLGRMIYDFGCSYAPQAWYFRNHRGYIGIDPEPGARLYTPNAQYAVATAQSFLEPYLNEYWMGYEPLSFAIVNYVTDPTVEKTVKKIFKDIFIFYPERGDDPSDNMFYARLSKSFAKNKDGVNSSPS